jgi:hypothetical protein
MEKHFGDMHRRIRPFAALRMTNRFLEIKIAAGVTPRLLRQLADGLPYLRLRRKEDWLKNLSLKKTIKIVCKLEK